MTRLLFSLLLTLLLSACNTTDTPQSEILSQKITPQGKIPVTVLVKYAFSINGFEQAVEKKFPKLDLIQIGNYTSDRGIVEYERRLQHDDLTDIVMTWPLDVGKQYWEARLLDLSSMPFTSRYHTSMLNSIAQDGRLYYLPGPAQVRGIVYNKTLFKEQGWEVPTDFKGFIELCQKIEASGIRALQLGFANPEVLDTAFVGYSYKNSFSTPADAQWLADYNQGKGSFGSQFGPALNIFQSMINVGIWKKSDLNLNYADRETMLFTRQCAMVEDSVLIAQQGRNLTGTTDEFALMPFFNVDSPSDWVRLYMVCYIGLNKHLAEAKNKEKYDLVLDIIDYISTPEGQLALAADTGAMYSSVKGVAPPSLPEITALSTALSHGRYAVFPELKNAQRALREGLAGMLAGTHSRDDVIRMVDQQNLNPPNSKTSEIIGNALEDFTLMETGNFITDAMRAKSGADVALFLDNGKDGKFNGKGVSARLYKGPQTMDDVIRVLPDLKQGEMGVLQVVEMTGAKLIHTLEYAIPVGNNIQGWFYYFSGLRMEYVPSAPAGSRIRTLTDLNNQPINPQRVYTVAIMDQTVPGDTFDYMSGIDISIQNMLKEAIQVHEKLSPSKDGRFIIGKPE